jgi:hypothetical protein
MLARQRPRPKRGDGDVEVPADPRDLGLGDLTGLWLTEADGGWLQTALSVNTYRYAATPDGQRFLLRAPAEGDTVGPNEPL